MVYMGRNLISKTTEGIWTKLKPEVSHALPLSSRSRTFRMRIERGNPNRPKTLISPKKSKRGKCPLGLEPAYFHCLAPPLSILSPSSPAPGGLALIDQSN